MICLVLLGKMIFLFPEKMILPPARKNTQYSLQMFWKDGLFKKDCTGAWSFLYHLRRWFFFPPKTRYFFVGRKTTGWSFSRNTRKHDIFYLTCSTAPCQKHQRWSYPAKIHLNVFDALDRHSRKGSNNSLYFRGDLYRRFHILLSSQKKNRKVNIHYFSFTPSSVYSVGDILQWIIFNTLYHLALRSCIWRCAWAPTKEIFVH